jgi:hypothetical protein
MTSYKFGIVIARHSDINIPRQYEFSLPGYFVHIWRTQSHHLYMFCPFTSHAAAQTSSQNSESANLNKFFDMFPLSNFIRRWAVAVVVALFFPALTFVF